MSCEPIAILGRGCVLPGALSVAEFDQLVLAGRLALQAADTTHWHADPHSVQQQLHLPQLGGAGIRIGARVHGFDAAFSDDGLQGDPELWQGDVITRWLIDSGRQALREAGFGDSSALPVTGMIMGNLSYPTLGHGRFALHSLLRRYANEHGLHDLAQRLARQPAPAADRFSSALPVLRAGQALGCRGPSFAIDAACASSLYAIKLACDRLQRRECALMLAGAVNHCDNLLLHVGFAALGAHSGSGRSLPFQQEADGLLPGEGAAAFVLCRLEDALRHGWPIKALIRGIGLANDGQRGGLLQPDSAGQTRALRAAYAQAAVDPASVSYVECHATGTLLGDRIELQTLREIYKEATELRIGSLKANLGHLITVAGGAGLLKLLTALQHGTLPLTPLGGSVLPQLQQGAIRLVTQNEPWQAAPPRRAGLNAFGFGGSNAHLILEEWRPELWQDRGPAPTPAADEALAIVGMAVRAGQGQNTGDFLQQLFAKAAPATTESGCAADHWIIDPTQLKTPPTDLRDTLGQHLLLLLTAVDATRARKPPGQNTGIYIGMGCDSEMTRHIIRWRLATLWRELTGETPDAAWLQTAGDSLADPCRAAHILGGMPNMPANRINRLLDIQGPGFTLAAEELSGLAALECARHALLAGEIDCALVGAVDLSCEPVHRDAAAVLLPANRQRCGDAATVLLLRRLADAERDGDSVIAVLEPAATPTADELHLALDADSAGLTPRFGHAHACSGLLLLAAAAAALQHAAWISASGSALPWLRQHRAARRASISVDNLAGQSQQLSLRSLDDTAMGFSGQNLQLYCYAAADHAQLLACLRQDRRGEQGTARLALVCPAQDHGRQLQAAIARLQAGVEIDAAGCFYAAAALQGESAFVFNGIAAAYSGVSHELTLAVPQLFARLRRRCDVIDNFPHVLEPGHNAQSLSPLEQIFTSILYGQLHCEWTRGIAGLRPQAMLGISAGEINCLFAAGVWQDLGGMFHKLVQQDIFARALSRDFSVVTDAWRQAGVLAADGAPHFSTWRVWHPVAEIQQRVAASEPLVRLSIIHSDKDCILIGEVAACKALLDELGARHIHLGPGISIHTPDIAGFADSWRALHSWPTQAVDDIRLYSNAWHAAYAPTRETVADALTRQALTTIDFRATVERAYADGVRIFIEHGARNLCSQWISDILGDRPHLCLAMDVPGGNSYRQALEVIARLWTVHQPVDLAAVRAALPAANSIGAAPAPDAASIRLAAHPPAVRLPPPPATQTPRRGSRMPPAPPLPATSELWQAPPAMATTQTTPAPAPVHAKAVIAAAAFPDAQFAQLAAAHRVYLQSVAAVSHNLAHALRAFQGAIGAEVALQEPPGSGDENALRQSPLTNHEVALPAPPLTAGQPASRKPRLTSGELTPCTLPPAREPTPATLAESAPLPGPKWNRQQLEILARDKVSRVFGELFARQDDFHRQVRMPMPPLLLADRVTGVAAEPGSLGTGIIWTETDVDWSSWYLHHGHMPAGLMVEAGQADLLLISYLGADFVNRGERVYRLLGCELIFHGPLARAGDTLRYEIHIDGHAQHGDVRLFFFHYKCYINDRLRISVRQGQAGFFSDAELASSEGVLWQAQDMDIDPAAPLHPPLAAPARPWLSADEVGRFCAGDLVGCFGPAFALASTHSRSPAIPAGRLRLLDRVTELRHDGGPAGRGYLRAELDLQPDHWFYQGHFKNDPCMPGTLMAEGCYQAMALYLSSLGFTLDKDGWRFEPLPDHAMAMRCRGQATPQNRSLVYEIFVRSVQATPRPLLIADILCSVDGRKAFHGKAAALQLVPGWPLDDAPPPAPLPRDAQAARCDDIHGDSLTLLACARGRPSRAFGRRNQIFDSSGLRPPRLPGPPYLFISRLTRMPAQAGSLQAGGEIEAELDIADDAWYFADNGAAVMPFCVLLEAALQPCGWLASFSIAGRVQQELVFRNLDGKGRILGEVQPDGGHLTTTVKHSRLAESAGMIIVAFSVRCRQAQRRIFDFDTVFGFFPPAVMARQAGLDVPAVQHTLLSQNTDFRLDLRDRPARYYTGPCRLADGRLRMLDQISGCWPQAGSQGLGALRGEKSIVASDWFFKAHFFQDPVQPGSLGLEAMLQLLQFHMLHANLDQGLRQPRFQAIASEADVAWKYRSQVTPHNSKIAITMDIIACQRDSHGAYCCADAALWVDGLPIYLAQGLGMRIVDGSDHDTDPA